MSGWRRIAPTLAPPSSSALAAGFAALLAPRRYAGTLSAELAVLFPGATAIAYDTGRAALAEALRAAMRITGRDRVVLPAYTSYSVASSASVAGAQVDVCDIDPESLLLDRRALRDCVDGRTAAVVLGNPYGLADPVADLGWLREAGVLLIDDAAQALGASEHGAPAGLRGDFGVVSFGRGKCVTLGKGGALLVRDPALLARGAVAPPPAGSRGAAEWAGALVTALCRDAAVFGALSRLPGLRVGESWYEPSFPIRGIARGAEGLAVDLAAAVARQRVARQTAAAAWRHALEPVRGLHWPVPAPGVVAAWLRVPVLAPSGAAREALVGRLGAARFAYVRSFPLPLTALDAFVRDHAGPRKAPGAESVAARIIALPAHVAIGAADFRRVAQSQST